ncbi:MAG: SCO2322 family protein [Actinomycetota bacterium]
MKKTHPTSIFLIALAIIFSALTGTPANAGEKGYRYWGYFQAPAGAKTWTMAMTGPSVVVPDGSVEGWAFTFSSESVPDAATPHRAPNFKRICGTTKSPGANMKRIGVIIDFGRAVLRPKGESMPRTVFKCVVVDKGAIGFDVLAKVVKIRAAASGFVCAFNNYPAKECGAEIPTPASLIPKKQ